jgi:hypothetical protein
LVFITRRSFGLIYLTEAFRAFTCTSFGEGVYDKNKEKKRFE